MAAASWDENKKPDLGQDSKGVILEARPAPIPSFMKSQKFYRELNVLKENVLDLITNISDKFMMNFEDEQCIIPFIQLEQNLCCTNNFIVKKVLEGIGLGLSYSNETLLLKIYKSEFKKLGIELRTNKLITSDLLTLSGSIKVQRYVLRGKTEDDSKLLSNNHKQQSICPLDDYLGTSKFGFKTTPAAMLEIAEAGCTEESFKAAENVLKKIFKEPISYETIRNITYTVGNFIFKNELDIATKTIKNVNNNKKYSFDYDKDYVLYIEADGAMIHLHNEQNAINNKINNCCDLIDDKNDEMPTKGWYENKLGVVFSSDNMVLKDDKRSLNGNQSHEDNDDVHNYTILKREYVSYIGSVKKFQDLLYYCALKNGYGKYKETVLISDGASWIKNMKGVYFQDVTHILDFYHLCEHVFSFGRKYFNDDPAKYVPWAKNIKYMLKESRYNSIRSEILKMQKKINDKQYNLYDYIEKNISNINYKEYRSKGYYIGSGHIESGNKSVFQSRLKRPGMTWNRDVAQSVLTLRSKIKSDLWDLDVVKPFFNFCYGRINSFLKFR